MVEDEYGRDPAVRRPNTTIILYPMTMISKRIERGEKVDVFELYNGTAAQVEALKRYRSRGDQTVRVEHVTVNEGGQAIVGNVNHGGRRSFKNQEASP